jgi:hypothetical protein
VAAGYHEVLRSAAHAVVELRSTDSPFDKLKASLGGCPQMLFTLP